MRISDLLISTYTTCTGVEPDCVTREVLDNLGVVLTDDTLRDTSAGRELKLLAAVFERAATTLTGDPLTQDQLDVARLKRELQTAEQDRDEALGYVTHIKQFVDDVFDRSLKD